MVITPDFGPGNTSSILVIPTTIKNASVVELADTIVLGTILSRGLSSSLSGCTNIARWRRG